MTTIIETIESQLNSGKSNCSFTYLIDGESVESTATLREIRNDALRVARSLPKQRSVLLLLPQGISFIKAFFGCLYARAVAIPMSIPGKSRGLGKLRSVVANAEVSYAVTSREILNNLRKWFADDEAIWRIHWFVIEEMLEETGDVSFLPQLPDSRQVAFLQYTSGSTGVPKGVMVTHENIVANSEILQTFFKNNVESVSVCWLPSFHDMGLIDGIIQPVYSGFRCVLMSPTHFLQKPVRWLRAITRYRATYSGGPNFAYDLCATRVTDEDLATLDLNGLHCLYNASEPIRHQTMLRFLDSFSPVGFSEKQLLTCYGLAEATLAATASKLGTKPTVLQVDAEGMRRNEVSLIGNAPHLEIVSSGYAYCDTNLKIIDADTLEECAETEIGEIWVSGKSVTTGYLNAPEITRETFVDHQDKRFLRTGDLGFLLKGELFVTGRMKDLIIIRGANHYPQDIEQTVYSSHPALEANGCAAFSVDIDEEEKLVVVQELKRTFRHAADYAAVFYEIMGAVSSRHGIVPHDIMLVAPNQIPKTSSGKIQRGACRRLWLAGQLKPLAVLREHLFYEKIRQ